MDHSPSWLALPEILAYDWAQTSIHRGVIPLRDEDEFMRGNHREGDSFVSWNARGGGEPKTWSGGVSGPGIVTINAAAARAMLNNPQSIPSKKHVFVTVSWQETYRESARDFLAFVDEFVVPLGDPERVRLVFGFDS